MPRIVLQQTSETEYCRAALNASRNEFWWYFNGLALYRGFSRPFVENDGRWWYRVKPWFAWPVNPFRPFLDCPEQVSNNALLGWQWPVLEAQADSHVTMNVVWRLEGYGLGAVASNKRRAVQKGLRNLDIAVARPADRRISHEARDVWLSHVERTKWNRPLDARWFEESWAELDDWPGTTVITARDPARGGQLCAWLIARCIDETIFVDTIASHTDRLALRPNDALIFSAIMAAREQGLLHAHYSLQSNLATLEAFKRSLGFVPHAFPARLRLRWPASWILPTFLPRSYARLRGESPASESSSTSHEGSDQPVAEVEDGFARRQSQ